jgi:hypothetical protein
LSTTDLVTVSIRPEPVPTMPTQREEEVAAVWLIVAGFFAFVVLVGLFVSHLTLDDIGASDSDEAGRPD